MARRLVTIGNLVLCLSAVLLGTLCAAQAAPLQLRVVSAQGQPLKNVVAGAPCTVEVIIPGQATLYKRPMIAGLDAQKIVREQESSQVFITNGVKTQQRTISYVVTFDEPGMLTLGPARVETAQGELSSDTLSLEVLEPSAAPAPTENFVAAEIKFEKRAAYVGEAIPYTVNFYYSEDAVQYVNMSPLQISDALVEPSDTVQRGVATYNNKHCNVLVWCGILYPQKAGSLPIPACHFDYQVPQAPSYHSQWAHFMQLFQHATVQKRTSTARTSLAIQSLPPYDKEICGVGTISAVTATLSTDTFAQGESAVLTLRIAGNAHMPSIHVPPLQIPEQLRVYESKVSISGHYPQGVKSYEYIVQGLQPGTLQIPAQEYTFFDPQVAAYKTFTTQEQTVYVMPTTAPAVGSSLDPLIEPENKKNDIVSAPAPKIDHHARPVVPLWLFVVLFFMPLTWWALKNYCVAFVYRYQRYRAYQKALSDLRATLRTYSHHKNNARVVEQWNKLVLLRKKGEQDDALWQEMQERVDALAFGAKTIEDYQAFSQALERVLRVGKEQIKKRGAA